jgi:hypothetical protein
MEAIFSSEKSVDFQRTTRRHIPEDSTVHNDRCANLKCYDLRTTDYYEVSCWGLLIQFQDYSVLNVKAE